MTLQASISAYIPLDRREALLAHRALDGRRRGSALFADISGSTAMAEALVESLGPVRGADEVSRKLNHTYDALIACVHGFGGSVIGFSGDAITCWFESDSGLAAAACALKMQDGMAAAADSKTSTHPHRLGIKVAISAGEIQRFLVGDPDRQVFDLIAGTPLERLAQAEHLAKVGEIVASVEVVDQLEGTLQSAGWPGGENGDRRFARVVGLTRRVEQIPLEMPDLSSLDPDLLRPWVAPLIFERLRGGQGDFLAELRPATALFLRFGGLDFDRDPAAKGKLDRFVRMVQDRIESFDGSLIQITVGDKGSYLYAAFGAPRAHEDDAIRAVSAALDLQQHSIEHVGLVSIGVSHGRMRTGAYGSTSMRTYGVLGDETNLAARLMQHASPGSILVSASAQVLAARAFTWRRVEDLEVKGKREPVAVFHPTGKAGGKGAAGNQAPASLPIVGREAELRRLRSWAEQAAAGEGLVIGICAEAGMGKSRLATALGHSAAELGFSIHTGESQSYGGGAGYLTWRSIWRGLFDLPRELEAGDLIRRLEEKIADVAPSLLPRLPLLSPLLNLPIPENELTASLDAKRRKRSLESMLSEYLRAAAGQSPLLLLLEDAQWIDTLSLDLLESLARAGRAQPVLFLLLFRPQEGSQQRDGIRSLENYHELELREFSDEQTEWLIKLKFKSLFGKDAEAPRALIGRVCGAAQGNPFYIEELLNYLHSQRIDMSDEHALARIELPASLTSLILSRIDQLGESEKATLHVASVIGRSFRADWVSDAFEQMKGRAQVRADLASLERFDLTQLETPEPDLSYLFKQILTREVAYESLPFELRSSLHDQLGLFIERSYAFDLDRFIEILAYHFSQAENTDKQRVYLLKAGERAQRSYANQAALDYYTRVLPLLPEDQRLEVQLQVAQVLELIGDWSETERVLLEGLQRAQDAGNTEFPPRYQAELGEFHRKQGAYEEAAAWLTKAREQFQAHEDEKGLGQVLHYEGTLSAQQGDYAAAGEQYERSLRIRRKLNDEPNIANLLNNLGILARYQGELEQARMFQAQSLEIRRALGDRWAIAVSLNNLGNLALDQGELDLAREQLGEALKVQREIGDPWAVAVFSNNLANALRAQGQVPAAASLYRESLLLNRQLGDQWSLAYLLEDIGCLAVLQNCYQEALLLTSAAEALRESIGAPRSESEEEKLQRQLAAAYDNLNGELRLELETRGHALDPESAIELALRLPAAGSLSRDASQVDPAGGVE